MTIGPIAAETTIRFPSRLVQIQSYGRPVPSPTDPTYSNADWPFIVQINPDDYPAGTLFIFEAIFDTNNASFPVSARLFNITDNGAVAGSAISTAAVHLATSGTRVRSPAFSLVSGAKLYRAQRGGESGSGAIVHLHLARLILYHA